MNSLEAGKFQSFSPALHGAFFYFAVFFAIGAFEPFLTVYFARLGLSGAQIGILSAFFPLMTMAAAPWISQWADRSRTHRRLLFICLIGQGVALLALSIPASFLGLLPLMVAYSLLRSPVQPVSDSMIVFMAARHKLDFGKMRLWGSLSFAAVSVVCGYIYAGHGYAWMFLFAGIAQMLVILSALSLEPLPVQAVVERTPVMEPFKDSLLRAVVAATFLVGAALGVGRTFEGVFIHALGGSETLVGAFFAFSALSEIPSMHFGVHLARRFPGPKVLILAYTLMTVTYLSYTQVNNPTWMLLLVFGKGFGYGLFYVNTVSLVNSLAPLEWKATLQSVLNAAGWGLGPLISAPLAGFIFDGFGPHAMFVTNALLTGSALIVLLLALQARGRGSLTKPRPLTPP